MSGRSVIIIGAGLAGLSAGCYCQMNGYETQIFEHHNVPGGVAATWKRKGYTIEGGIHFLMGHRPGSETYTMYQELGTAQANRFLDMPNYGCFLDQATGRNVTVVSDLDQFAASLKAISPADAKTVDFLIDGAKGMRGAIAITESMLRPPELKGRLGGLRDLWEMRGFLKYMSGAYNRPVAKFARQLRDPFVRFIVENLFLPDVPVSFTMMILSMVANDEAGLLENGSVGFVLPIEKRYRDLGGRITYRATVEKILVENDRAVGVRLADGSEHSADTVVSAADGYSTIFGMLDGRYADDQTRSRYANWRLLNPYLMVSFGMARQFPDDPPFNTIRLQRPLIVGNRTAPFIFLRVFNYTEQFAPPGKTVIQVEFEGDWEFWSTLRTEDRPRYYAEKQRIAAEVLERIESLYPGVASQVEVVDVATPYTTWRYTRNHKGSFEGWLPTPEVIMTTIPRTLPGLKDFYMAGQWVVPGGGVPTCLYSGRHVAQILCRRDGKRFVTSMPQVADPQ